MKKFRAGNVIRTAYGSLQIVTSVKHDGYTNTIHVNYRNSSAGHRYETFTTEEQCFCGDHECEYCRNGTPIVETHYGMDRAELVAGTVREWITSVLLDGFNF